MAITNDKGRIGEFLAAYILEANGVECHHVDRSGSDLWCRIGDAIVTVQVKAATAPNRLKRKVDSSFYAFHSRSSAADWFCFVALDRKLLLLQRPPDSEKVYIKVPERNFTEENQAASIATLLESVKNPR